TSPNGHRWLILKNAGPAVGYGHAFEASATYDHYWTGDFGGSGTVVQKIPSGSHWGATTRLKQEANVEFWANWNDVAGPTEPSVIVDGVSNPLVLGRGTLTSGAWTATLSGLGSGCHAYYFSFRDSASQVQTYPTTGSFGIGNSSCADWGSSRTTSNPPPGTPTGLVATASSSTEVAVSWNPSANAAQYQLERSSNNGAFALLATVPGTTYTNNTSVSGGTTYLYRVRALNAASVASGYSNVDHATTVMFTDDPLGAQTTVIRSVHLTQLRTAVNAMRAAAGLLPAGFTDSGASGVIVRAVHITELRTALDSARSALGLSTAGYSDSSLTSGMTVRAVHFQELRDRTK
ncbi:MAG: fibronectin type III domain-containing protein, partial [Thermoanaerobaculia bacterium]